MAAFDTAHPADSVEFCPRPGQQDILVCGTYQLHQSGSPQPPTCDDDLANTAPQLRTGKCLLFRATGSELSLLHETALPAVLDMKWCHREPSLPALLGIADSEGGVSLHELSDDGTQLRRLQSVACTKTHTLCLSLDWSNRRNETSSVLSTPMYTSLPDIARRTIFSGLGNLIVSLSDGSLALLRADDQSGLVVSDTWAAHDYEPWISAWNYWDTNVVYSGGDDLMMKGWDIREDFSRPIFTNKRFDAGVTTIQSHPYIEHLIAVGSYDNTVRLFDTRRPLTPLTEADVGGGAWRVKWHPSPERKRDLLVACMHDGFKIIRFGLDLPDFSDETSTYRVEGELWGVVKRFDEHQSLAYGVDWSFGDGGAEDTLIASCSFYDHTLRTWRG
ncbi:WD-40 repeat-containing protein [Obba rivulosa]|uniref:methylated diphthine methylhydrolase n=1 Tax=Obba rivulosa TaxID=1052685 RepID=A0A8E2DUM0_9APHY|nr:WD-40 repeat-containing protein [Obba rivulosa]